MIPTDLALASRFLNKGLLDLTLPLYRTFRSALDAAILIMPLDRTL